MDQTGKNPPAMWETGFDPWIGKIPWRRAWQPMSVFLSGESTWTEEPSRLQSMSGKELGMTECINTAHFHSRAIFIAALFTKAKTWK